MVYKWIINNLFHLPTAHCRVCDMPVAGAVGLCSACHSDLPRFEFSCRQCGNELAAPTDSPCGHCLNNPPDYDRVIAGMAYEMPIRQLIAQFKFQAQLNLLQVLSLPLLEAVQQNSRDVQALLPVPLHPSRLRQRGFNQAVELARLLGQKLSLPLLLNQISRQRPTPMQSSLPAAKRGQNLRGAFSLNRPIEHKHIAIVDDVMTTGSTAQELAGLLKKNGVEYVEVWCVARASHLPH